MTEFALELLASVATHTLSSIFLMQRKIASCTGGVGPKSSVAAIMVDFLPRSVIKPVLGCYRMRLFSRWLRARDWRVLGLEGVGAMMAAAGLGEFTADDEDRESCLKRRPLCHCTGSDEEDRLECNAAIYL